MIRTSWQNLEYQLTDFLSREAVALLSDIPSETGTVWEFPTAPGLPGPVRVTWTTEEVICRAGEEEWAVPRDGWRKVLHQFVLFYTQHDTDHKNEMTEVRDIILTSPPPPLVLEGKCRLDTKEGWQETADIQMGDETLDVHITRHMGFEGTYLIAGRVQKNVYVGRIRLTVEWLDRQEETTSC